MDKNYLNKILLKAQELKASDIHLSSNMAPLARALGNINKLESFEILSAKNILDLMLSIMDKSSQNNLMQNLQTDFAYYNEDNKTRYRANVYKTHFGLSAVFRQLNSIIPSLEDSKFPDIFNKIVKLNKGLVLVCGPTGSGKSTTLAILINHINSNFKKHIITIEDPIEYVHKSILSLVDQREVGRSVFTFSDGLRGALREDPDIILVGEMRDKETIKMALTAAETGHLVFATMHTMSASKTLDRIIDSCDLSEKEIVRSMISTSLQAVILQTLLKNNNNTGLLPAFEILIGTSAIRNMIRENKIFQIDSVIQTGSKFGMVTMNDYIEKLMSQNLINKEEAFSMLSKIEN